MQMLSYLRTALAHMFPFVIEISKIKEKYVSYLHNFIAFARLIEYNISIFAKQQCFSFIRILSWDTKMRPQIDWELTELVSHTNPHI